MLRTAAVLAGAGIGQADRSRMCIAGVPTGGAFQCTYLENRDAFCPDGLRADMEAATRSLVGQAAQTATPLRAIVLEYTNMPPCSRDVQALSGVPVYDVRSGARMLADALRHLPDFDHRVWCA